MRASKGLLAAFLFAALGLGAWLLVRDRGEGPTAGASEEGSASTPRPPSLAGGRDPEPAPRGTARSDGVSAPSQAPGPPLPGERAPIRVHLPKGVDPAGVRAALQLRWVTGGAAWFPPLTWVPTVRVQEGDLWVSSKDPGGGPGLLESIEVSIAIPGRPTAIARFTDADWTRGSPVISIAEGVPFDGRVQDRAGRPVPGLRLLLTSAETRLYCVSAEDLELDRRIAAHGSGQHVSTVTREDGTFSARVEPGRTYAVLADDEAWMLSGQPWEVVAGKNGAKGVVRTALGAVTLRGTVSDAGTDRPLSGFHLSIERREGAVDSAFRFGDQGETSPYRLTWARGDPATTETCDVSFEVKDYLPEKATVRWLPGESLVTHDVRLRTVASAGGRVPVTIEVLDADGRAVDAPFFVEIRTPTESPTVLTKADMTRTSSGRYASELPPGEADLRVVLYQHFYWAYSWHGRVLVESGRDLVVKAQVPSGAPLAVQWSPPNAPERFPGLFFRRTGDAQWSSESLAPSEEAAGTKLVLWPSGSWEFARAEVGSEPAPGAATGSVTLAAGQPATLELKRPTR